MIKVSFNEDERPKKKVTHSSKDVHCIECNRLLGQLLLVDETQQQEETKYQFICPCGGESFSIATYLITRFLTADDLTVSDCQFKKNKSITTLTNHNA